MMMRLPAAMGLVPLAVDGAKLQPANALLSLARSGAIALGAASGGVLVATVGAGWAMARRSRARVSRLHRAAPG